jgi:hypothetical protein
LVDVDAIIRGYFSEQTFKSLDARRVDLTLISIMSLTHEVDIAVSD